MLGFPLNFDCSYQLEATEINHASEIAHRNHIDKNPKGEISFVAMCRPFDSKPFKLHESPFMTHEKTGTTKCKANIDPSWPQGLSVTAGITKNKYLHAVLN